MDKKACLESLLDRRAALQGSAPVSREARKAASAAAKEIKKLEDPEYLPLLQQLVLEKPGEDEASRWYREEVYWAMYLILSNRLDPDGNSFPARFAPGLANGRRRNEPQQPDLDALSFLISRLDAETGRENREILLFCLGAGYYNYRMVSLPLPEGLDLEPLLRLAQGEDEELRRYALQVLTIGCPWAGRRFSRGRLEEGGMERYPHELIWMIGLLSLTGTAEDIPLLEGYLPVYKKEVKDAIDRIRQREKRGR